MRIPILLGLLLCAALAQAEGVRFQAEGGWAAAQAPEEAQTFIGHVVLINQGDLPLRFVAAGSADFRLVEFRELHQEDGFKTTRTVAAIEIPAHGRLALGQDGVYLALQQPVRRVIRGGIVVIDLITEEGDPLPVALNIRATADP
ncbi:MAG: copper chaperone PCu(A)C [Lysobacteraceae bacterium]